MTKPDNLLTGFILLLIVERRLETIMQFSQFVCLMKITKVAFVTAGLHQVPQVAIHNTRFTALAIEIDRDCFLPVQLQFSMSATRCRMGFSMQHIEKMKARFT